MYVLTDLKTKWGDVYNLCANNSEKMEEVNIAMLTKNLEVVYIACSLYFLSYLMYFIL